MALRFVALLSAATMPGAFAALFRPNNFAVMRLGDGSMALGTSGARTDIIEVDPASASVVSA